MAAIPVVVALKLDKLHLKVACRPEERAVQALASNSADQTFDEGMRAGRIRHRLDFFDIEDAQVRLPSVTFEQPIMV
jgi:hypothetical protein